MLRAVSLLGLTAVGSVLCAAIPLPEAATARFADQNYGLVADIPPGLFVCPPAADWVGSDHGVNLYMRRPTACDAAGEAAGTEADTLPRLQVFYSDNVAETVIEAGSSRVPVTDAELMSGECGHQTRLVSGLTLFGRPARACATQHGGWVNMVVGGLYRREKPVCDEPDCQVFVTLRTPDARLAHDFTLFEQVTASLRTMAAGPGARPPAGSQGRSP